MGRASKGSRKGKKAWRANIHTDDIDDFFEKQTRDAHAGVAAIPSLPSDSLFYVDKPAASASTSAAGASDTTAKDIPVKRKIEKKREKVLYHESVLKRNPFVQPVPSSVVSKKDKKKEKNKKLQETQEEKSVPMEDDSAEKNLDIWGGEGKGDAKAKKSSLTTAIPAVEVEPPGCSFNPPFEAHQDSLAQAVADELRKTYTKELGPKPVPLIVPGEAITEEDKFFLDADDGDEDVAECDEDHDADALAGQRKTKTKRVTRVELNRRARRKERLRAEAEAKKIDYLSKEIDSLPNIIDEIGKEDEEKEKRRIRRTVAKEDRLKSGPPRLGRHKFEPAPVQVLLTEEISGSLRKLKGCCNLGRDRYKSIEKRGILAPSKRLREEPVGAAPEYLGDPDRLPCRCGSACTASPRHCNPEDGPEAYSNATVHNRLSEYTSMAREVHGPEYDPSTEDLDGEVVMRVGGGKKHGRYWIGDGAIDSIATPSLSQIRASSTSTSPAIRPRKDTSHHRVEALEAQLEQERRIREQMQATMERVEAEREAEQRRMVEILQYMQSLGAATGVAPPPSLFAPPPPPHYSTPNQSAASNDPHASANPSPNQFH